VPETAEPGSHRLDIGGTVLIGGALFAIVDAIIEAPGRGWTGTGTLAKPPPGWPRSPSSPGGSCASPTRSST